MQSRYTKSVPAEEAEKGTCGTTCPCPKLASGAWMPGAAWNGSGKRRTDRRAGNPTLRGQWAIHHTRSGPGWKACHPGSPSGVVSGANAERARSRWLPGETRGAMVCGGGCSPRQSDSTVNDRTQAGRA